jgi:hypothetical protein
MLMADPQPADAERLKGYDYSRVTVGEHRTIFVVREAMLHVVAVGKRNDDDAYRRLAFGLPRGRGTPATTAAATIHCGSLLTPAP